MMMEGVIVRGRGGFYTVRDETGQEFVLRAKKKFRRQKISPLVGDRVLFTPGEGKEEGKDEDGWVKRWDYEGKVGFIPWGEHAEVSEPGKLGRFFVSDMYYAPQFVNGGALILLDTVVDSVEQETWGELSVLKISSSKWENVQHEQTDYDLPRNFVVLFHPEQGWIFAIRGTMPMAKLVKIAENLEVEQTEGLVESAQFENPYDFFDAARG